jgi:hypothetical protein
MTMKMSCNATTLYQDGDETNQQTWTGGHEHTRKRNKKKMLFCFVGRKRGRFDEQQLKKGTIRKR